MRECEGRGSCGPRPSENRFISDTKIKAKLALLKLGGNCSFHPTSAVPVLTTLEFYFLVSLLSV